VKEKTIDPKVHIGHVHLKVANLQRALDFYCGVLGFELPQRYGEEARDPDGNGIELYWDRPKELWPRDENGQIEMSTRRLELGNLLGEL
jgi:catechol-2,3-dioxygenase